jgi:hypothetical protein
MGGRWPSSNCRDFIGVNFDAVGSHNVAEEFNLWLFELALGALNFKIIFSEPLKYKVKVVDVLLVGTA